MTLPAPNLDDRRFQDLVDDCKRLVQQRCPEWTDHNVSDPGVTLIEVFAWLADQLLYRFNRVPDRHYVKFLELIGVRLFPPNAARTGVTFWLSAPQPDVVRIEPGTKVATSRTGSGEPVTFSTTERLDVVPCALGPVLSSIEEGQYRYHGEALGRGVDFFCFDRTPKPGDSLFVGLSEAVPACAVALRFDARIEGIGVDPSNPPLVWEAWTGDRWEPCDLERDETGGINRAGDIVLHVPRNHEPSIIAQQRAGWLRARVVTAGDEQPPYSASPTVRRLSAFTIGGTANAVDADIVSEEVLGFAEGTPGQRFSVTRTPVVPSDEPVLIDVAEAEDQWQPWTRVADWSTSGADDRHFVLDDMTGDIRLGPAVRLADGTLRQFGRVPPKGSALRVRSYLTGGGQRGNVSRGSLTVLKSSIPYVSRVENRRAASGGRDGETIDNAKERAPVSLRTRGRAVTVEDFELIAAEAALEIARVKCLPADSGPGGGARVLLVPYATDDRGRLAFGQMVPTDETFEKVTRALDERRLIGTRIIVEPPQYMGLTVVARLRRHPQGRRGQLQEAALEALFRYFHPLRGGPEGSGWPFGRAVHLGEVYAVLQAVPGLGVIEDVRLFAANPATWDRGREPLQRLQLDVNQLVFSVDHQVVVEG